MALTYEPIATTTLGTATDTITFSSIPGTYTDLKLIMLLATNVSTSVIIKYNNNAGMLYSQTYLYGLGSSTASSGYGVAQNSLYHSYATNTFTSTQQFFTMDIFSYAGSTYKVALLQNSAANTSTGSVDREVGLWSSTAAITSLSFNCSPRTFNVGTTATLYGIKAA
jgi:hypothetical protein